MSKLKCNIISQRQNLGEVIVEHYSYLNLTLFESSTSGGIKHLYFSWSCVVMTTAIASVGCNIKHTKQCEENTNQSMLVIIERIEINETLMRSRRDRLCMVAKQTNCNIGFCLAF